MSKKKIKAFACAMAAALAFIPFLGGCTPAAEDMGTDQGVVEESAVQNQQGGSADQQSIEYAQVMAVNGDQVTVVLGELTHPSDGEETAFASGQDEVVFSVTDVTVMDESGAVVDAPSISADDVLIMRGTGSGSDFKPQSVEIVNLSQAAGERSE